MMRSKIAPPKAGIDESSQTSQVGSTSPQVPEGSFRLPVGFPPPTPAPLFLRWL
jgi:hypothetical protein